MSEPCQHCGGTGRVPTEAERLRELAARERARGRDVTDEQYAAEVAAAGRVLGG